MTTYILNTDDESRIIIGLKRMKRQDSATRISDSDVRVASDGVLEVRSQNKRTGMIWYPQHLEDDWLGSRCVCEDSRRLFEQELGVECKHTLKSREWALSRSPPSASPSN